MADGYHPQKIGGLGILVRQNFIAQSNHKLNLVDRAGEENVLVEVDGVLADVDQIAGEVLLLFVRLI